MAVLLRARPAWYRCFQHLGLWAANLPEIGLSMTYKSLWRSLESRTAGRIE